MWTGRVAFMKILTVNDMGSNIFSLNRFFAVGRNVSLAGSPAAFYDSGDVDVLQIVKLYLQVQAVRGVIIV